MIGQKLLRSLQAAKWLPATLPATIPMQESLDLMIAENLLGTLEAIWNALSSAGVPIRQRRRWERLVTWARCDRKRGACISVESARRENFLSGEMALAILNDRLMYWENGIPGANWVGVVSSRLGRQLDQHRRWFDAFRAVCRQAKSQGNILVTAEETTPGRFARRASELFELPSLLLHEPRPRESLERWLNRILTGSRCSEATSLCHDAWLSPRLNEKPDVANAIAEMPPLRDQLVVYLANRLFIMHLRRGGNIERLVRARLALAAQTRPEVFIPLESDLVPDDLAQELVQLGAIGWVVPHSLCNEPSPTGTRSIASGCTSGNTNHRVKILTSMPDENGSFLTHCTRSIWGPWPDQSESNYLAELLSGKCSEPRTPLASLRRIVEQRLLVATSKGIRGAFPVVCFTSLTISQIGSRRVFRPHRGRWDFEPYGIAIQREWLLRMGTRAVVYGEDSDWLALDAKDRPFFQRHSTRGRRSKRIFDWSVESEWRHFGDVSLRDLPSDAAILFVPNREDAELLVEISPWPVLIV